MPTIRPPSNAPSKHSPGWPNRFAPLRHSASNRVMKLKPSDAADASSVSTSGGSAKIRVIVMPGVVVILRLRWVRRGDRSRISQRRGSSAADSSLSKFAVPTGFTRIDSKKSELHTCLIRPVFRISGSKTAVAETVIDKHWKSHSHDQRPYAKTIASMGLYRICGVAGAARRDVRAAAGIHE